MYFDGIRHRNSSYKESLFSFTIALTRRPGNGLLPDPSLALNRLGLSCIILINYRPINLPFCRSASRQSASGIRQVHLNKRSGKKGPEQFIYALCGSFAFKKFCFENLWHFWDKIRSKQWQKIPLLVYIPILKKSVHIGCSLNFNPCKSWDQIRISVDDPV